MGGGGEKAITKGGLYHVWSAFAAVAADPHPGADGGGLLGGAGGAAGALRRLFARQGQADARQAPQRPGALALLDNDGPARAQLLGSVAASGEKAESASYLKALALIRAQARRTRTACFYCSFVQSIIAGCSVPFSVHRFQIRFQKTSVL